MESRNQAQISTSPTSPQKKVYPQLPVAIIAQDRGLYPGVANVSQGSRPSLPRRRLPTRPDFTRQVHCKLLAPGASIRARRPPISRCPPSFISSRIALPFPFVFSRQASATCELRADLAAISQAQFAQATRASC